MNIKNAIIKTNDILVYILLAFVLVIAILVAIGGQPIYATGVLIVGWIIVAMLSGVWICLSSIADNSQRQVLLTEQGNALLKKQVSLLEKIYESRTYDINFQLDE